LRELARFKFILIGFSIFKRLFQRFFGFSFGHCGGYFGVFLSHPET